MGLEKVEQASRLLSEEPHERKISETLVLLSLTTGSSRLGRATSVRKQISCGVSRPENASAIEFVSFENYPSASRLFFRHASSSLSQMLARIGERGPLFSTAPLTDFVLGIYS